MSKDQVTGVLERGITVFVTWLLTYASTKGYLTTSQVADFLPLLIALGTAVIGWYVNRPQNLLMAVANIPEVRQVLTSPTVGGKAMADSVPSNKVTTQ